MLLLRCLLLATTTAAASEITAAPPAAAANPIPYERHGVMAWNVGPPTGFWWNKTQRMMVYEAARFCRDNGTYWPPAPETGALQPYSLHSFFRIRDLLTGEVVGNVQGSECFAYGSAVVDPVLQRAWVFGSERDLCGGKNKDNSSACAPYWQGRTARGNGVRAWWSDDLTTWHTAETPALLFPSYPFNTDVTPVVHKSLVTRNDGRRAIVDSASLDSDTIAGAVPLDFLMVSESGRVAAHAGPGRSLSVGWVHLANETHGAKRGFGACPAVHYGEEDGFFYVISGGTEIALARTRDLEIWEHAPAMLVETPPPGSAEQKANVKVSPFLALAAQAQAQGPGAAAAATLRSDLAHPECWEGYVNDADMCCGGPLTAPGAPTDRAYVLFSPSSQGKAPDRNCSTITPKLATTNFNGIASANTSLTELLASRFPGR